MKTHSEGPWLIKPEEVGCPYIRIRGTRAGGRYKIANVLTPVYDGSANNEAEETRANAALIAAAPNLLDAAERAEWWLSTVPGGEAMRDVLRAAIKLARRKA